MKRGKRIAVMLATFLMTLGMFTIASFAADFVRASVNGGIVHFESTTSSDTQYDATYKFDARDSVYNGYGYDYNYWLSATKTSGSGTPSYTWNLVNVSFNGKTGAGETVKNSTVAPSDVGEYTVTAHYRAALATDSHMVCTFDVSDDFKITPKPVAVTWDYMSPYPYKGQVADAQVPGGVYAIGDGDGRVLSADSLNVKVAVDGAQKDAGTYTATASLTGDLAYRYEITDLSKTKEFVINKKEIRFGWNASQNSFYYNGEEQHPEPGYISHYEPITGDDVTVKVSGYKDVGDGYTSTATLEGKDAKNYEITDESETSHEFKIVQRPLTIEWSDKKLIYNGKVQYPEPTLYYMNGDEKVVVEDAGESVKVYSDSECRTEVTTKTEVGFDKKYYAKLTLPETGSSYSLVTDADNNPKKFIIYAKEVTVTLESDDPITYDGKYHKPEVSIEGVVGEDVCKPVESLTGKTKATTTDSEGNKTNTVNISDVNVDEEKGVYHASVDKYLAKVENKNTVEPEAEGYDVSISGLKGTDAHNYKLADTATCSFAILPLEISLDWYRPAYNEYGDLDENAEPVLVDVAGGEKLTLVFNGQPQAPVAKIKTEHLLTNPETDQPDKCEVTVSAPENAVEARERAYKATEIAFSNPDYTRDRNGTDYYIIPRPVKLKWDAHDTVYNGQKQERKVSITNIQKNDRNQDYSAENGIGVVEVSKITYTDAKHFGRDGKDTAEYAADFNEKGYTNGSDIAADRNPIDAGTYRMTAAELSDEFNYTLFKLNVAEPTIIKSEERVDEYDPCYTIHQHVVDTIDWSDTTKVYNASWQEPEAALSKADLQGPDTAKECSVVISYSMDEKAAAEVPDDAKVIPVKYLPVNAGKYNFEAFKLSHEDGSADRSMNYFLAVNRGHEMVDMPAPEKTTKNIIGTLTITKAPLTVTANDATIKYGEAPKDNGFVYDGLLNGAENAKYLKKYQDAFKDLIEIAKQSEDEDFIKLMEALSERINKSVAQFNTDKKADGTPTDTVFMKDGNYVPAAGAITLTQTYQQYGKYGKYAIVPALAAGYNAQNYDITFVNGTLTVQDVHKVLMAKVKAKAKGGKLTWTKVDGAKKYVIYFSHCDYRDTKFVPKKFKTLSAKKTSYTIRNLKRHNYYKFYVVALDKSGKKIAKSELQHFTTGNLYKNYTNPRKLKLTKKTVKIADGGTFKIKSKVSKMIPGKKLTNGKHTKKLRYVSENKKVATVTKSGKIKGVRTGWTRVYVMVQNGIWQTVQVYVK